MSRYRKIDVRIWNDAKFCELSRGAQFIFLFLLTHPGMTSLGAMRATIQGMAAEIKQELEPFREQFAELSLRGLIECDETVSYVGLPNFLKYNGPDNPNAVKSWASCLDLIPECRLKYLLLQRARKCAESRGKGFAEGLAEPFREPFADGSPNQEQEQEQEQELKKPEASGSEKPKSTKKKSGSVFDWIDSEDLRDIHKLILWHRRVSQAPNPVVGKTEQDRLNVVAAAVKSWDKADDPVKLFAWIVGRNRWDFISQEHEDTAHALIKQYLSGGTATAPRKGGASTGSEIINGLFPELGVAS